VDLKQNVTQGLIDVSLVSSVLSHVRLQPKLVQSLYLLSICKLFFDTENKRELLLFFIVVVQVLLQEVLNSLELTTLANITALIVVLNDQDNCK
jgi:hypothetical protein